MRCSASESHAQLLRHPRSGASWEGFALEQVLRLAQPVEAYFWATHTSAELDLLMIRFGKRVGVEFRAVDAPRLTPSMRTALADLSLDARCTSCTREQEVHTGGKDREVRTVDALRRRSPTPLRSP